MIRPLMMMLLVGVALLPGVESIGHGAFRDGPTLRLDGGGNETLLEKLRRLDREAADARRILAERDRQVADIERENALLRERGQDLTGRVELLEHARISLEHARQEVADRGKRLDALAAQLTASERARLVAERQTFDLAAEILALQPGDAQALIDLQSRLRVLIVQQSPAEKPQP